MLSQKEIQTALHASRVVPIAVSNPHGPFGLEQLAEAVSQLVEQRPDKKDAVERPISLPVETWEKLDDLARKMKRQDKKPVSASDVATSFVIQGVQSLDPVGQPVE